MQLLVRRWNERLSRDILAHWLDLLSEEGWIAREQVLFLQACMACIIPGCIIVIEVMHMGADLHVCGTQGCLVLCPLLS